MLALCSSSSALRAPALARLPAPHARRCCAPRALTAPNEPAALRRALYEKMEAVLRRARGDGASPSSLSYRYAQQLGKQLLTAPPEQLVEAVLTSGGLLLDNFDEGLAILGAAEAADVEASARAYSAVMRLAQVEGRPLDTLALLARVRARVPPSEPCLLLGMGAAAELGDWGAVARLDSELRVGEAAAAEEALALETIFEGEAATGEALALLAELNSSTGAASYLADGGACSVFEVCVCRDLLRCSASCTSHSARRG